MVLFYQFKYFMNSCALLLFTNFRQLKYPPARDRLNDFYLGGLVDVIYYFIVLWCCFTGSSTSNTIILVFHSFKYCLQFKLVKVLTCQR